MKFGAQQSETVLRFKTIVRLRIIIILLLLSLDLRAQNRTGNITGTVTDPDGHAVVSAPVQASNIATAIVYKATTSAGGNYALAKLPAGSYILTVPDVGFTLARFERKDVRVQSAQTSRIDIHLQWGGNLGTPGDDQSIFNMGASEAQRGPTPRTREGKPDFSGVWIGSFDPNTEMPILLPWAESLTKERIANLARSSTLSTNPVVVPRHTKMRISHSPFVRLSFFKLLFRRFAEVNPVRCRRFERWIYPSNTLRAQWFAIDIKLSGGVAVGTGRHSHSSYQKSDQETVCGQP